MAQKSRDPPIGLAPIPPTHHTIKFAERKARSVLSKSKFRCGFCGQACWGKPDLAVVCGSCGIKMQPAAEASSS